MIALGLNQQWVDGSHQVVKWDNPDGTHSSASVAADDVAAWLENHTPAAAPAPGLAEQLAALVAAGFALTSTGTPALDGTYRVDQASLTKIAGIYAGIKGGDGLPGGGATFGYLDMAGAPHAFDADQFVAFAKLIRDFDYAGETVAAEIAAGGSPALPVAAGVIA
jgi:hypothetical protein